MQRSLNSGSFTLSSGGLSSGGLLLPVCADVFSPGIIAVPEEEGCSFFSDKKDEKKNKLWLHLTCQGNKDSQLQLSIIVTFKINLQ